jgi:L,D-transpeptidase ErfK/SrfK
MLKKWFGTHKAVKQWLYCAVLAFSTTPAFALVYDLPTNGNDIVGSNQSATVKMGDTLSSFAQRNDAGYYELLEANPRLNPMHLTSGIRLLIPHQFILPDAPREGIVINLAELRLYYYQPGTNTVLVYPIGIGRPGGNGNWGTPVGELTVIRKKENPEWHPPQVVIDDMAKRGIVLPPVIPAGPDNPLGNYMLRLSNWSYLIHGTNKPEGVGRRTSAGCIRMYPEDIEALFAIVPIGTKVTIVDQPFKAGWLNNQFYFEAHMPLREQRVAYAGNYDDLWNKAITNATASRAASIDWNTVHMLAKKQTGVPQVVGQAASQQAVAAAAAVNPPVVASIDSAVAAANTAPTVVAANTAPTVATTNTAPTVAAADTVPTVAVANTAPTVAAVDPAVVAADTAPTIAAATPPAAMTDNTTNNGAALNG